MKISLSLFLFLTLVPCFRANRLTEDVPLRGVAFPFCLQEMGERFGRLLFKEVVFKKFRYIFLLTLLMVLLLHCFYYPR